jgi:hypothetical protein
MKHFQKPTEKTYLIDDIFDALKIGPKEKEIRRNLWKMDRGGLGNLLHYIKEQVKPLPRVVPAKRVTVVMLCPRCQEELFIPLAKGVPLDMFCDSCNKSENIMQPIGVQIG